MKVPPGSDPKLASSGANRRQAGKRKELPGVNPSRSTPLRWSSANRNATDGQEVRHAGTNGRDGAGKSSGSRIRRANGRVRCRAWLASPIEAPVARTAKATTCSFRSTEASPLEGGVRQTAGRIRPSSSSEPPAKMHPQRSREASEKGSGIAANLGFVPRERNDPRDRGPERFGARSPVRCQRIPANGFGRQGGSSWHLETVTRASAQAPRCLCFDAKATTKVRAIAPCRLAAAGVRFGERTEHETQPARPASRRDSSPDGSKRRCRRNSRRDPHATVRLLDVVVQPGFGGAPYGVRRGVGGSFGSGFTRSGQGQRVLAFAAPRKATRPAWKPASRVGSPMRSRFVGHGRTRASARVKAVLRHRGNKRRGRLSRHASRS